MTAFWQMPYGQDPEDPDAIDVTGFGDPVRSFISPREPTAAELAEFRASWLREAGSPGSAIIPPDDWDAVVIPGSPVTGTGGHAPPDKYDDGPCAGCGTDGLVDAARLCTYCAELGGLRAGQAARARTARPWRFIPANLLITDLLAIVLVVTGVCAIVYAILQWLCRTIQRATDGAYSSNW